MEPLQDLYDEFKKEMLQCQRTGTKADKIRHTVSNLSDYLGDRRLCLDAVFDIVQQRVDGLCKGYFTSVVRNTWTTEKDDNGVEWIRTDRPKGRWHK
ncbi:MAG: hypothetical protein WC444_07635 [Candidatus Paceibacterota bacterium]